MPFDPNFPFVPGDPSQWWRARALPRIIVQPNAPPSAASGNPAGSDGIDDWLVPGQAPNPTDLPNDWIPPGTAGTNASLPDDWIYPDNQNAPTPPWPSPPPGTTPAISNRPAPPPDPFAAYWSLIPASRVGALAWAPSIFPNSFGQFPSTTPALPPLSLPSIPTGGLLGGIPKMLAAQAAANDPWANGILGGIPKMLAASAPPSPLSAAGSRGILGALANLQPTSTDALASMLGALSGTASGSDDRPPSLLDDVDSPPQSPPSISPDGFGNTSVAGNNMSGQSFLPGYAWFDASRDLISPPPDSRLVNPAVSPIVQRTGLTLGDSDQSTLPSVLQTLAAPDLMVPPYKSGSATSDHLTVPLDPTAWGGVQLAAGDREKIDPEDIFDPLAPVRTELYYAARYDLRQLQPNNYALSVPSFRRPGGAPTIDEIGELKYAYRVAQSTQPLADTASRIARLVDPLAQNFRTVSVLQTPTGTFIAGSGDVGLERDQRDAVKAAAAREVPVAGVHAEIAALDYAKSRGELPQFIAASRPFCPVCRTEIQNRGGLITSPTTAVFPRNFPSLAFPLR